jgi:heat shock protein HslJ
VDRTTGLNNFMGEDRPTDAGLSVGPLGVTRRACADRALGEQEQGQIFLKALPEGTGYEVVGPLLRLTIRAGKVLELELACPVY